MTSPRRARLALGAAVVIVSLTVSCGTAPRTSASVSPVGVSSPSGVASGLNPSPSPPAKAGVPVAVLVNASSPNAASPAVNYTLALVRADGSIAAKASPRIPSAVPVNLRNCPQLGPNATVLPSCQASFRPWAPLVMSSNARAYFLDGDSDVGYLTPDGHTGTAVHLPADAHVRYAVAVSPDDSRIAVASLDYLGTGSYPKPDVSLDIFVQDLSGSNRVDLFTSSSVTEWPIGWHDGHIVIAVGPAGIVQSAAPNPYFASEYHVVDAATGARLATLGAGDCQYGPLVKSGTACLISGGILGYQGWDGTKHSFVARPDFGPDPDALAPDGSQLAGSAGTPAEQAQVALVTAAGINTLGVKGFPQGWLDDSYLVYYTLQSNQSFVLDLATKSSAPIAQTAPLELLQFVGTVPQQIG